MCEYPSGPEGKKPLNNRPDIWLQLFLHARRGSTWQNRVDVCRFNSRRLMNVFCRSRLFNLPSGVSRSLEMRFLGMAGLPSDEGEQGGISPIVSIVGSAIPFDLSLGDLQPRDQGGFVVKVGCLPRIAW